MIALPRIVSAADIAARYRPPEFPKVRLEQDTLVVDVNSELTYEANATQAGFLGLVHHLSQKRWCDRKFISNLIARTANECDWTIHPFQTAI
jgi:hypothetical protein